MAKIRTEIDGDVIEVEAETIEEAHRLLCLARPIRTDICIRPVKAAKTLRTWTFTGDVDCVPRSVTVVAEDFYDAHNLADDHGIRMGLKPGVLFETWKCGRPDGDEITEGVVGSSGDIWKRGVGK